MTMLTTDIPDIQEPAITRRTLLGGAVAAAAMGTLAVPAFAQSAYPSRPVKFVVPFPAGGPVDTTGRAVAQKLSEMWGQQAIVDNRAGAGGIVGAEIAAKLPADGYNVFVCSIHHSVLPSLKPRLTYDIEKDFVPVSFGAMFPVVLVAHPDVPVKTVADIIALDKRSPGKLSFGSSGSGGGTHLAGELFNMQAGTKLLHVPYKGSAPAMTDLLGGQVQFMFSDAPTALPQIKAGKVRAIAVASAKRSALLPDVPTVVESGLPGYEAYSWAGFLAPAGTPKDVVQRLSADIGKALSDPQVKQRLYDAGAEAAPTTPEAFAKMLHTEIAKWTKVVRTADIKVD
ncbi:tripartite tricarboxylate transporter substrate binding protein [Variovorax sp. J2L1-78]|uniref:tripartite tricarboxylate transporter substrate binding protein n=2 Tax=Variovorax arabinosiphilus TaxID=3053498 RepID=UPI00257722FD|nr:MULTISPECIES: tripartite tricarboxylate transporter substrate binding protein [unclassified Variovorax]MDM0119701.1 tripartite tricarboxylate transporter substrate binding protein [Variovorax sp. J2L1-78]MDM0128387.1 tripartite tricarboxylate transporter substrate binding protein [Variovorax sp. J2L1-63]MDM0232087.1 tripartite tricarboxylate transporter substrate binding protein [Variovorax sp. J2R1-6]